MAREDADRVASLFEAWNREGLGAIVSGYHPDVIYHTREDEPEISVYEGRDAFGTLVQGWLEAFPEIRFEVEEVIDAGDYVVVATVLHGRGGASGIEVHEPYVFVYEMGDGLVVEAWEYRTKDEALEAVPALSPHPSRALRR